MSCSYSKIENIFVIAFARIHDDWLEAELLLIFVDTTLESGLYLDECPSLEWETTVGVAESSICIRN